MIAAADSGVTVTLEWSEARTSSQIGARQTITLTSQISADALAAAL